MKNNSTKQPRQLPAPRESSTLRMVYKNEEVINKEVANSSGGKLTTTPKGKLPNKLFVKEALPMFNDYKFKARDHDPL
jgi:hypothetical protein